MQADENIDFSKINWDLVDLAKSEFIYNEALKHHRGIIENNNRINDKALGLLSFTMPVMAALSGYFAISWGTASPPLFAAAVSAGVFLFGIIFFLLLVIIPRGIYQGEGSPSAYFSESYYKRDMRQLLIGNIINLHNSILHDRRIMNQRGLFFRIAVILLASFPAISFTVFILCLRG